MKNTAKLFAIASSALLLGIVAVASWGVNRNAKILNINQPRVSIWADGSVPIPPPPTGTALSITRTSKQLLADGSVPIPPPPTGTGLSTTPTSSQLLADGSVPIPPPPTGVSYTAIPSTNS